MARLLLLLAFLIFIVFVGYVVYDYLHMHKYNPPEKPKPKAIDYSPESVLGWEDIQWSVEKKLKEDR